MRRPDIKELTSTIRADLKSAVENGHDMLANFSNQEIADDLNDCTTGYEDIDPNWLVSAIQLVREEGL